VEVIDDDYVFCPLCESTNSWVRVRLPDESEIVLTRQ